MNSPDGNDPEGAFDTESGQLTCVGIDAAAFPSTLSEQFPEATKIDDSVSFPELNNLDTLSLNKNNIDDLAEFLKCCRSKFPKLSYLSLLGNSCCPSELTGGTATEYADYRKQVIGALPSLRFLDSQEVQVSERPKTVTSITDRKLTEGIISRSEHEHILRMHHLIQQLEESSTDALLSESEDECSENNHIQESQSLHQTTAQGAFEKPLHTACSDTGSLSSLHDDCDESRNAECSSPNPYPTEDDLDEPLYDTATLPENKQGFGTLPRKQNTLRLPLNNISHDAKSIPGNGAAVVVVPLPPETSSVDDNNHESAADPLEEPPINDMTSRETMIAMGLGDIKAVTLTRGPTGFDMQLIKDEKYLRVSDLAPRGVADIAGLQVGDVVLACNGDGLVGSSEKDAVELMEAAVGIISLQVAELRIPLPILKRNNTNAVLPERSRKFSVGLLTKSVSIRPLYCEAVVLKGKDGKYNFGVNLQGDDALIELADGVSVADVKEGDVIKGVDGEDVTCKNILSLLKRAKGPEVNLDIIRYMIEDVPPNYKSNSTITGGNEALEQTSVPVNHDGVSLDSVARPDEFTSDNLTLPPGWERRFDFDGTPFYVDHTTQSTQWHIPGSIPPPTPMLFDCMFKGATQNNNKNGDSQIPNRKVGKHHLVTDDTKMETLVPGRVRLKVTPESIVGIRLTTPSPLRGFFRVVTKSKFVEGSEIFKIGETDMFTVISRKRKMLLMVQPAPPTKAVCYVLKFSKDAQCKRATLACEALPGNVVYDPNSLTKVVGSVANVASVPVDELPEETTTTAVSMDNSTVATVEAPRRRKLVRGGNVKEIPVLPEYTAALAELDSLGCYLDELLSEIEKADLTELKKKSFKRGASRAMSRKLVKEMSRRAKVADVSDDGDHTIDSDDDDDDDGEEEEDDEDADLAFFAVLETKRIEREMKVASRQAELRAQHAAKQDALNAQKAIEMAKIDEEREAEALKTQKYKEYCVIGASKRLNALSFKFKFGGNGNA